MLEEAGELTRRQGLSPDQPSDHGGRSFEGEGMSFSRPAAVSPMVIATAVCRPGALFLDAER
jgi:hypothetical protein